MFLFIHKTGAGDSERGRSLEVHADEQASVCVPVYSLCSLEGEKLGGAFGSSIWC